MPRFVYTNEAARNAALKKKEKSKGRAGIAVIPRTFRGGPMPRGDEGGCPRSGPSRGSRRRPKSVMGPSRRVGGTPWRRCSNPKCSKRIPPHIATCFCQRRLNVKKDKEMKRNQPKKKPPMKPTPPQEQSNGKKGVFIKNVHFEEGKMRVEFK